MNETPMILYIISDKRSGSTLLENILSKSDEAVSLGEVAMLKNHILREGPGEKWGWSCSCGEALNSCGFWAPIIKEVLPGQTENEFETKINWSYTSFQSFIFGLFPRLFKKKIFKKIQSERSEKVVKNVLSVYHAVYDKAKKKFIIDSTKLPIQALAIYQKRSNLRVKFIFLTRDIRGIAYSKKKSKEGKNIKVSFKDLYKVWLYKRFARSVLTFIKKGDALSIRYEDLATHTEKELKKIFSFSEMKPFDTPTYMELNNDHTLGGTPKRFEKRKINLDETWKKYFLHERAKNLFGVFLNKT
ncbi:MAG: sulfotransferase domain-containing protein [Bacteroidetes bacterium]|nr:sulfotransferase domain-containing protein [Bacteroidota bacterium]